MSLMKILVLASVVLFGAFSSFDIAHAAKAPIYTSWQNNIAVGGYDPVSFFSGVPVEGDKVCLLYTSPSPRDATLSRMPSSA